MADAASTVKPATPSVAPAGSKTGMAPAPSARPPAAAGATPPPPRSPGNGAAANGAPAGGGGDGPLQLSGPNRMPPIDQLKGRPIGRVLIKMGRLTREQVHKGLGIQQEQRAKGIKTPLGQVLIEMGLVSERDRNLALAAQAGYEAVELDKEIAADVIKIVPAQMATQYKVVPFEFNAGSKTLKVAFASADNFRAADDLRTLLGFTIIPAIADAKKVQDLINKHYGGGKNESITEVLGDITTDQNLKSLENRGESIDMDTLKELAESNPVKRLLNMVLMQAIKDRASDIHFEPFENEFKMRYRIDGVLYEMVPPPKHIAMALTSRVKVMANLDIAERRLPQDGRIALTVGGRSIDLRVAILPTIFGESTVMRVLDRAAVSLDLEKVGLRDDDLRTFRQLVGKPNGIVFVTGPTGSGKTTTLYAALNELNDPHDKLITTEDPVEYDIDGIIQVNIKTEQGLTFAKALRAILRQDPDIVLVGEVRDKETAKIAVEAALTGHLVFSTLHTNDAPGSIARLLDLGVEPFLITGCLEGVVAQRLVRRICTNCKEEFQPTEEQIMELELLPDDVKGKTFFRGRGCEVCNNTGYKGRMGLYEIMVPDDEMRDMIMQHASTAVIRNHALKRGMRTLRQCGLLAVYEGITTIEELVKHTITEA